MGAHVLESGHQHLRDAVDDGTVSVQLLDSVLRRAYKVMFHLGYFEKEATRPVQELQPEIQPHEQLALEAARQSIVLLKNASNARTGQPPLPIDSPVKGHRSTTEQHAKSWGRIITLQFMWDVVNERTEFGHRDAYFSRILLTIPG